MKIDKQRAHALLYQMKLIRRLEEACVEYYSAGMIRGFLHLYIGQEAVAVGIMEHVREDDAVVATYREHAHALLKGLSAPCIMSEMFGTVEGCSRGRGGSMHLFSAPHRFFGGNAIVGGGLPMAVGLAMADKMQGRDRVTLCFFGEGAVAEGEFHEAMNLAELWKLPVLFCCENNSYAMGTHIERSESVTNLVKKAESYGVPAARVDGMDVLAVSAAAKSAIERVRSEGWGPYFLECQTYRFRAHSMFDPELYRSKAEVDKWKQRGPILTFVKKLTDADLLNGDEFVELAERVRIEIAGAVAYAKTGAPEAVEDLRRHVYWEGPPLPGPAGGVQ